MKIKDAERAIRNLVTIYNDAMDFNGKEEISNLSTWKEGTVKDKCFMLKRFHQHFETCRFCIFREKGWCKAVSPSKKITLETTCSEFLGGGPLYEEAIRRLYFPEQTESFIRRKEEVSE